MVRLGIGRVVSGIFCIACYVLADYVSVVYDGRSLMMQKKQTTAILVVVVGLIVMALVIGGVMLGSGKTRALKHSWENLAQAETLGVRTELVLNLPPRYRGVQRPFTKVTARVEGDVQETEDGTPTLAGTLLVEARGRGNIFFADGELRILEEKVLFRLDNLPVFLNPSGSLVDKWTAADTALLVTHNAADVQQALTDVFLGLDFVGNENVEGERLAHFSGQLSSEQEDRLTDVLRQGVSGNRSLHVIARLLQANNVKSLDVWVDRSEKEVRRMSAHFVRPLSEGREFDFATLTIVLRDYGKNVVVEEPETKLTVHPSVFSKLFGSGEVEQVQE